MNKIRILWFYVYIGCTEKLPSTNKVVFYFFPNKLFSQQKYVLCQEPGPSPEKFGLFFCF